MGKATARHRGGARGVLSTEYAAQVVRLSLVSQVAQSYFDLRNLDLQLDIARGTLASREEAFRLVTKRSKGGVVSELDLRQPQSLPPLCPISNSKSSREKMS